MAAFTVVFVLPLRAQAPANSTAPTPAAATPVVPAPTASIPPKVQQRLDKLAADLVTASSAADQKAIAIALNQLGEEHFNLAEFAKALEEYGQALPAARAANDARQIAAALNGLADCDRTQGQEDQALALYAQALAVATASGDLLGQSESLNGMGWASFNKGQLVKSLDFHTRALPLARQAGDGELEGSILRRTGNVYYAMGDRQQAMEFQKMALPVCIKAGDRRGEGRSLGNIGQTYSDLGEKQLALEYMNRAAPILEEEGDRVALATALNNIGLAYSDLGDQLTAVRYFARSLPLFRQMGNPSGEATELGNVGGAFASVGDAKKAEMYDRQAVAILRRINEPRNEAIILGNLAVEESILGDQPDAIDHLNQSLALTRQVGDRSGEALSLIKLGSLYDQTGDKGKALDCYKQALPLATAVKDPLAEAFVFDRLMLNQEAAQPTLAIFYGKQAVNFVQQVRGNIRGLNQALQTSFLNSTINVYHDLADLLIAQGRLPEAQRVLDLLKQQEYQDYARGDSSDTLTPLALTPEEKQAEEDYARSTMQTVARGQQWAVLNKTSMRTPEQEKQYKELTDQLGAAEKSLDQYYDRLYVLLGKGSDANSQIESVQAGVSILKQELASLPQTVALYTLVGSSRTSIIVITGSTEVARQVDISEADLNRKVAALQQALRDRSSDPRPAAQELYKILIEPVKADLDQAHAATLVWSLDGVLRYVPMAALYDGKQYLVEKYSTVVITPASLSHLADKPDVSDLKALAMGISLKYEPALSALPAVAGELNQIVTDTQVKGTNGVLPGTILLDSQFTEKAMEEKLHGQYQLVHIASHFVFKPGDNRQSYLLLAGKDEGGDGFHLTVSDFKSDLNLDLSHTDLLTLSACETGISGNASNGREIDGLGTTAQKKGAKAVISSLWSVNDASTGELMGDFYKRWSDGKGSIPKVDALRQAQLDMLLGRTKPDPKPGSGGRGAVGNQSAAASPIGFAHPFYWAPFVLMGNWR